MSDFVTKRWVERWTKQETECETGGISEERKIGWKRGRLMKWASQIKADMAEERGGRLQKTLMSQPFIQTTLLQQCTYDNTHTHTHAHEHMHCTDGRRTGQSGVACSCITLCEWRWVLTLQPPHANLAVNTNTLTG